MQIYLFLAKKASKVIPGRFGNDVAEHHSGLPGARVAPKDGLEHENGYFGAREGETRDFLIRKAFVIIGPAGANAEGMDLAGGGFHRNYVDAERFLVVKEGMFLAGDHHIRTHPAVSL